MTTYFQAAEHGDITQIVNDVADTGVEYVLCRDGKAVAVVVSFDRYEQLRRAVEKP